MTLMVVALTAFLMVVAEVRAEIAPAAGTAGRALRFSGVGQQVRFDSLSRLVTGNATFEAWVSLPVTEDGRYKSMCSRFREPDSPAIISDYPQINHTNAFADWNFQVQAGGRLNFFMGGRNPNIFNIYGAEVYSEAPFLPNVWQHVAFSFRTPLGATAPDITQIYLDGVLVGEEEDGWNTEGIVQTGPRYRQDLSQTNPIYLGRYVNPEEQAWFGWMDEIRFWDVYRTAEEVAADRFKILTGEEPGLLGYYRVNQRIEGPTLLPEGPSQHHGLVENVAYANSGVPSLPQTVTVVQGVRTEIRLQASDPVEKPLAWFISALPSREGSQVWVSRNGVRLEPVTLNEPLYADTIVYQSSGAVDPVEGADDELSFYVQNDNTVAHTSAPTVLRIHIQPAVGCDGELGSGAVLDGCDVCNGQNHCIGCDGNFGSGQVEDECEICGGDGTSCVCIPETGHYGHYDEAQLDKIILLYDLEVTIKSLQDLDAKIDAAMVALTEAEEEDLDLSLAIEELQAFNEGCLEDFCLEVDNLVEALVL
ncbi:Papilin, proteoglycan like sulfated glycoprotein [Balamuthia mandrillaris]